MHLRPAARNQSRGNNYYSFFSIRRPSFAISAAIAFVATASAGVALGFEIRKNGSDGRCFIVSPSNYQRSDSFFRSISLFSTSFQDGILRPLMSSLITKSIAETTTQCQASEIGSESSEYDEQRTSDTSDLLPFQGLLDPTHFRRMDIPERGTATTHAIYGALIGNDMIESYDVFQNVDIPKDLLTSDMWPLSSASPSSSTKDDEIAVVAVVKLGKSLNGHEGIVHGGILALVLDDVLGFGYESLEIPIAFTANLSINYISPVPAGSTFLVIVFLTAREGRKIYWRAEAVDFVDGRKHVFCEATSLYIVPRQISNL